VLGCRVGQHATGDVATGEELDVAGGACSTSLRRISTRCGRPERNGWQVRTKRQPYRRIASSSLVQRSSTFAGDSIGERNGGSGMYAYCSQSSSDQCTGSSAISPAPVSSTYGRSLSISDES
jgi:hypothetical protein